MASKSLLDAVEYRTEPSPRISQRLIDRQRCAGPAGVERRMSGPARQVEDAMAPAAERLARQVDQLSAVRETREARCHPFHRTNAAIAKAEPEGQAFPSLAETGSLRLLD